MEVVGLIFIKKENFVDIVSQIFVIDHIINIHFSLYAIFSILIAAAITYTVSIFLGTLAFWFRRVHGFNSLFYNIGGIFSGDLIPVDLLPLGLLAIGNYLPFKYMAYFPAQLMLRGTLTTNFLPDILAQLFWVSFFGLFASFVWKKGLAKFEATGR